MPAAADHRKVLSIALAVWLFATALVVSLCRAARQGDDAQGATARRPPTRRHGPARQRHARTTRARVTRR
jgi:hypothetical protein